MLIPVAYATQLKETYDTIVTRRTTDFAWPCCLQHAAWRSQLVVFLPQVSHLVSHAMLPTTTIYGTGLLGKTWAFLLLSFKANSVF